VNILAILGVLIGVIFIAGGAAGTIVGLRSHGRADGTDLLVAFIGAVLLVGGLVVLT